MPNSAALSIALPRAAYRVSPALQDALHVNPADKHQQHGEERRPDEKTGKPEKLTHREQKDQEQRWRDVDGGLLNYRLQNVPFDLLDDEEQAKGSKSRGRAFGERDQQGRCCPEDWAEIGHEIEQPGEEPQHQRIRHAKTP